MLSNSNTKVREEYIGRKVRIIKGTDVIIPYEGDKSGEVGIITGVDFELDAVLVLLDGADKPTRWSMPFLEFLGGK